ncbi:ORF6N domain-containing protein [bacterium]|nr:ORF6N domain-containing protein [bacterium]
MENEILTPQIKIEDKILVIRGQHVMIDRDLAELYGVETRSLNQAVKRNIERFPERFMFQLTKEEMFSIESCSRSQFVILNEKKSRGSNIKYLPYAFTEQGMTSREFSSKARFSMPTQNFSRLSRKLRKRLF